MPSLLEYHIARLKDKNAEIRLKSINELRLLADPAAMDLLLIQKPGMTLDKLAGEMSVRLRTPYVHIVHVVEQYKRFKRREAPYPLHPYAIELAKLLPHFLIMGLGALAWYNRELGDSSIIRYLWSMVTRAWAERLKAARSPDRQDHSGRNSSARLGASSADRASPARRIASW